MKERYPQQLPCLPEEAPEANAETQGAPAETPGAADNDIPPQGAHNEDDEYRISH
jgi:hypothetical protein